jgi:hypothetical protein
LRRQQERKRESDGERWSSVGVRTVVDIFGPKRQDT